MAPHSSTLAWKIPWTEEPGRLQFMESRRVGHDWATSLSLFIFMHWRWKWQPAPVFLPGESQGQRSLVHCCLWGHTESDTTAVTWQQQQHIYVNATFSTLSSSFFLLLPHFLCLLPSINPQMILHLKEGTQWEGAAFYCRLPWNQCLRAPDWIQTLCCIWEKQLSFLWGWLYVHPYIHTHTHTQQHEMKCGNEIKHAHQLKPFLLTAHIRLWAAGSKEQCQGTGHLTWFLCGEFQTIIIKFREVWCHASGSGITHTLWANHVTSIFIACNYICGDRRGWLVEASSVITA